MQQVQDTYSPALPSGYVLKEYVIESVLGIGSYGITYLAHDSNLHHKVAVKEFFPANLAARNPSTGTVGIKSSDCQDEFAWGKTRYTQEAQTLARFNHPNIVRVSRYFEANSTSYLVMDFVEGKSLETTLKDGQDWTQTQLLDLLLPLLAGLMEIHKVGYLHRDIKPDNIILRSKDNSPVLIDFGAARSTASNTCMTAMVSPGYGPAEQYSSDTIDQGPWTDIYALAAVAYRIVTGSVPIPAPNRIKKDALIPAVFVGNDCYSKPLLTAIDQALSIDETKRPQTASDFAEMLIAASAPQQPQTSQLAPPSAQAAEPAHRPGPKPEIVKADASITPTEHAPLQATGLLPTSTPNAPPQHASQHDIAKNTQRQFKPMPTPEPYREQHNNKRLVKWAAGIFIGLMACLLGVLSTDKGYLYTAHFLYTTSLKANNPDITYVFVCSSYFNSAMSRNHLEKDAENDPWATVIDIQTPLKATITSAAQTAPEKQTWARPTPSSLWCRDVLADYHKPRTEPAEQPKTPTTTAHRKKRT